MIFQCSILFLLLFAFSPILLNLHRLPCTAIVKRNLAGKAIFIPYSLKRFVLPDSDCFRPISHKKPANALIQAFAGQVKRFYPILQSGEGQMVDLKHSREALIASMANVSAIPGSKIT